MTSPTLSELVDRPLRSWAESLAARRDAEPPVVFLVERIDRISRLDDDHVLPVRSDDSFNGAVTGVTALDGRNAFLLSPDLLLLS